MTVVKPKKSLGQHFLKDENIAKKIVAALADKWETGITLEIGPGMGVLTKYLLQEEKFKTHAIDIDEESIKYLKINFPELESRLLSADFLELDLNTFNDKINVIGNFPYNISSQILFQVLKHKNIVPLCIGMFQKEVAERIAASPNSKIYGILSVLVQAFYTVEYLFTVPEHVFIPPPKVKSAVIRLTVKKDHTLECDEKIFFKVVKAGFNQRRKTLRNALKVFEVPDDILEKTGYSGKRAEQLSVNDFVLLSAAIEKYKNG